MKSVEFFIELLYKIEVQTYTQQLLVEIVFDHTGFSFMLISYYQFVIFCVSFFRVTVNILYISMLPFIWEFWLILPFVGWIFFWFTYIRTLKYIIWFRELRTKFFSSYFITHELPKWRDIVFLYTSYFNFYTNMSKNYINLHYSSLSTLVKMPKILEFVHNAFLYMPHAFKYGNRKQSYFRNFFNSKKKYNNWIWKWRK